MKKLFIFIGVVLIVAAMAIAIAAFFAQGRAASFIKEKGIEELNKLINTQAEVGEIRVNLLRGIIYFSDLRIKNPGGFSEAYFVNVPSGYIDVGIEAILFKRIEIDRVFLDTPKFDIEIKEDGMSNTRMIFKKTAPRESNIGEASSARKKEMYFGIKRIDIKNGIYQLINYKVNAVGARIMFNKIGVSITNLTRPMRQGQMPTLVKCQGEMPSPGGTGRINIEGKGGFLTELIDFDANLHATDISLPAFMPFYVNTAPILAVTGNFDLTAEGKSRRNGLDSTQLVSIRDLQVAANPNTSPDNTVFGLPMQTVMRFFINSRGDLDFSFAITGALSDPRFHLGEALKKVLAQSIANAIIKGVSKIPNMVMEKVKETGNIEDAGKKVLQDVFKRILGPKQESQDGQQPQDNPDLQSNR